MPRQLVTVDLFVNPSFNHTYTQTCVPFIHGTLNHSLLLLPKNLCCTKNSEPPNETKQACKQTKQQQQMHANHKAPSNLLIHMYGLCAVLCIEYLSFHFDIQKKAKQNMNNGNRSKNIGNATEMNLPSISDGLKQ